MKSQPKHPWYKKAAAKYLKKAMLKKMWNQNGLPRPPAVVGIKIFNNDDQAAKHYFLAVTFFTPGVFWLGFIITHKIANYQQDTQSYWRHYV